MKPYTLWTLNDATLLVEPNQKVIDKMFSVGSFGKSLPIKFGDRSNFNAYGISSKHPFNLMYEGVGEDAVSEYFVPIPIKCIGNKFKDIEKLSPTSREKMEEIQTFHPYFSSDEIFNSFWGGQLPNLPNVGMATLDKWGYYSILEKTAPNILIGYSQGGLVARYLAFLDEYVFQSGCVSAVITIQSPNFGSPLANPKNKNSVADGLIECILALFSFNAHRFPSINTSLADSITFDGLRDVITAMITDTDKDSAPLEIKQWNGALKSAKKWLSGLDKNPYSAFHDLDITSMEDKGSVLNLVNNYPLHRIYHGAIVGADNSLDDLVKSFISLGISGGAKKSSFNVVHVCKVAVLWLLKFTIITQWKWLTSKIIRPLGSPLMTNFSNAAEVYTATVMKESPVGIHSDLVMETINRFFKGVFFPNLKANTFVKRQTHDFVIPSAYQLLPVDGEPYLGARVNKNANHNTGRDLNKKGGRQNFEYLMEFLKMIKHNLISDSRPQPKMWNKLLRGGNS